MATSPSASSSPSPSAAFEPASSDITAISQSNDISIAKQLPDNITIIE